MLKSIFLVWLLIIMWVKCKEHQNTTISNIQPLKCLVDLVCCPSTWPWVRQGKETAARPSRSHAKANRVITEKSAWNSGPERPHHTEATVFFIYVLTFTHSAPCAKYPALASNDSASQTLGGGMWTVCHLCSPSAIWSSVWVLNTRNSFWILGTNWKHVQVKVLVSY